MPRKRKHNNTASTNSKFKTWAKNNWAIIATLFISVLALAVSLQANILTMDNSSPLVRIAEEAFDKESLIIIGCNIGNSYEVKYYIANEYTFSNTGGRAVSLVKVTLHRGDQEYHVRVYSPQSFDARTVQPPKDIDFYRSMVFADNAATAIFVPTKAKSIKFPLKIESGTGEKWFFQGDNYDLFQTAGEAESAIVKAENGKNIFSWKFEFNDGTVLKSDKLVLFAHNSSKASDFPDCQNQ